MMIGTVMMSNSNQTNNNNSTNNNLLLTTANSNQQINSISQMLTSNSHHKYHQEISDTEISERTYRSKSRYKSSRQTNEPPNPPSHPPPSHTSLRIPEASLNEEKEDKIQVQILPMDDNWADNNTTAHTADFSDFNDDMTEDGRSSHFNFNPKEILPNDERPGFLESFLNFFRNYFGLVCAFAMSFCSFLTPILFILLPRMNLNNQWQINECGLECEGLLIGIAFKLFILLLGNWAIFLRRPKSSLPRIYELRALLVFFLCIMTFSYWLFYTVRIIDTQTQDYYKILQFTVSYVDVLLFIFIISVFILELRHLQPQYVIKIIRSPDGLEKEYTIGTMSIQRTAIWILEQYYRDFKAYNPWLESAHRKRAVQLVQIEQANKRQKEDTLADNTDAESTRTCSKRASKSARSNKYNNSSMIAANLSANDRLYEEYEYERRLKKRRARLLIATEEAFNHIRRVQSEMESQNDLNEGQKSLMDPFEAAQAVFCSIVRDLRRYLRITKQQPFYTKESIVAHLANCISYDMTPKSFLQRYIEGEALLFNDRAMQFNQQRTKMISNSIGTNGVNYSVNCKTHDQTWILISDSALYQSVEDNLMFVLKQNEITLMCTFKRLPRFNLIEDILDPKRNKFVLKLNTETTV